MKKMYLLFVLAAALFSCKKDQDNSGVFKGPETTVYGGKAWTSIMVNKTGTPEQIALTLDDALLNSVSSGAESDHEENDVVIPLHPKAKEATPFQFMVLDWNPHGHPPAGIYDKPHFDFHWYMVPKSDVDNYTDPVKLDAAVPADYVPANYIGIDPVPLMGKHWVDVTSPELNGQPFTQTFIYGSYDSKVTFYEPMITLDFLKNTSNFERSIPQPAKFQKSGFYPTKLRIVKHNGVTDIIFDGLTFRQAS